MHDGHQDRNRKKNEGQMFRPPSWLSTQDLEEELLHAIQAAAAEADSGLTIIDEYFAATMDSGRNFTTGRFCSGS